MHAARLRRREILNTMLPAFVVDKMLQAKADAARYGTQLTESPLGFRVLTFNFASWYRKILCIPAGELWTRFHR